MINSAKKKTKKYYHLLKHRDSMANLTRDGENKWAEYLQAPLSVDFLGKKYRLTWKIKLNNGIKVQELYISAHRQSLNYRVSKALPQINPGCSYCIRAGVVDPPNEEEKHIYSDCPLTSAVWLWLRDICEASGNPIALTARTKIFGNVDEGSMTIGNVMLSLSRYYIYSVRAHCTMQERIPFLKFLRRNLGQIANALNYGYANSDAIGRDMVSGNQRRLEQELDNIIG